MKAGSNVVVAATVTAMDAAEARELVGVVRAAMEDARSALLELYQRDGWRALGYPSWRACVTKEFDLSQRRVYQLLSAAQVEQDLRGHLSSSDATPPVCTTVQSAAIPERVLRPLARIEEPEQRRDIWNRAVADSGGQMPTSARIAELVAKARGTFVVLPDAAIVAAQPLQQPPRDLLTVIKEEEEALIQADRQDQELQAECSEESRIERAADHARKAWKAARMAGPRAEKAVALLLDAKHHLECLLLNRGSISG